MPPIAGLTGFPGPLPQQAPQAQQPQQMSSGGMQGAPQQGAPQGQPGIGGIQPQQLAMLQARMAQQGGNMPQGTPQGMPQQMPPGGMQGAPQRMPPMTGYGGRPFMQGAPQGQPAPVMPVGDAVGAKRGGSIGFAMGGAPDFFARRAMSQMHAPGLINSAVPGRTDHIPINVPSGSYVLPADHVSHLGQGNSAAGGKVLDGMFSAPGMTHLHSNIPKPPQPMRFAKGGPVGRPTPIIVAGGEYLLHPEQVRRADEVAHKLPPGTGDIKRGHEVLDKWVTEERKKHVKKLKSLPGPRKD
jgi:hypothetical protein